MTVENSQPAEQVDEPVVAREMTILVVDDDEANRESLGRRLQRRGYQILSAVDGSAALEQIAGHEIDLVLLDVMMPGISGLEVLRQIRQTRSATDLPVIMATANERAEDVVEALESGANDYVTKPLDFAVVAARVRTQLSLKQAVARALKLEHHLEERNAELERANRRLLQAADRTKGELEAAARVQEALLPTTLPEMEGFHCAWAFKPCQELAGDALNIFALDSHNIGMYVLDVSGHGVPASLLAVAATRLLSDAREADSIVIRAARDGHIRRPTAPADVADRLNRKLALDQSNEQYLTLFYAVLNVVTCELSYVSAGHPGAIHLKRDASLTVLDGSSMPIGVGDKFGQRSVTLAPGDRVYIYSDGVTEAMNPERDLFGAARLHAVIEKSGGLGLEQSIGALMAELDRWRAGKPANDDVSVVALECPAALKQPSSAAEMNR